VGACIVSGGEAAVDGAGAVSARGAGMGGDAAVDGAGAVVARGKGEAGVVGPVGKARDPMGGT
jgi:hypothetical protein